MYWISSSGGPLVVLPKKELRAWRGAAHGGGDHDLVCSVDNYAGVVDWGGQNVLFLGDEPHQTAVKVTHQGGCSVPTIRVPSGKQLAHGRGREAAKWREAAKGYDHVESPSRLQDTDLHKTQHKLDDFGRANKERP
jgi:hypothetical protein